jgi:hypothetical protein
MMTRIYYWNLFIPDGARIFLRRPLTSRHLVLLMLSIQISFHALYWPMNFPFSEYNDAVVTLRGPNQFVVRPGSGPSLISQDNGIINFPVLDLESLQWGPGEFSTYRPLGIR